MASSLRAKRSGPLYVPEENPEAMAAQEYAQSKYNELMDPYRKFKQGIIQDAYNNVLQQTGDPRQAESAANSIAGKISRTEFVGSVVAPEVALAGAGRSIGAARDLASRVMGGSRAAEAPAAVRALPPPSPSAAPRTPIAREPVSTPDVIPMGGPLRDAPQIGYIRPEQRYTMRDIRQSGERAGPPTRYQMEARESARNPVRDQTYVPLEDVRVPRDVVSDPGGIPTLNTEGKLPVSNAPKWANERLAQEQRIADAIAEGNIAPDAMRNARALSDRDEALFLARQQAQATDDGMNAMAGQYRRQPGTAVVPAQTRQLQSIIDKHFGAPTVAQAEGRSMATGPTHFAEVPAGGPKLVGESFAGPQAPGDWYRYASAKAADPAAAGGISPLLRYGIPAVLAGGAGVGVGSLYDYASSNGLPPAGGVPGGAAPAAGAPDDDRLRMAPGDDRLAYFMGPTPDINDNRRGRYFVGTPAETLGTRRATASATEAAYGPEAARQAAIDMVRGRQEFEQGPVGSGRGSAIAYPTNVEGMNNLIANMQAARKENAALDSRLAREAAVASNQSRAQEALSQPRRPQEGMMSKIFGQPATTKQLFEQSQADPGDAGAWMRAERQYARTHRDEPNFDVTKLNEQGMKRGGSAGGKQDSVHKALEIIHHLIAAR
jgi:hypothetical protein